jgi:coatomer subunit beta'
VQEKKEALKGVGGWSVESVHGGPLLAARGNGFVAFWDWETGEVDRRAEVERKNVGGPPSSASGTDWVDIQIYWLTSGTLVAITADDSFYILRFDAAAYQAALESGVDTGD